jgi:large repetitive protein
VQQGTYNLEIAALPDGSGTDLYAGTINVYKCRITNPASPSCSFLNLTHVYGCLSIANVHPDQHHLAGVIAGGKELMYFANDGGVYRALDGYTGLTTGTCPPGNHNAFDDLNGTLGSMTQFVSFSVHPTDPATMLGGTQDNGSPSTASAGTSMTWGNAQGGDGGYNAISPTTPNNWFAAYPDVGQGSLHINYCGSGINCSQVTFAQVVGSNQVGGDDGAFYFPYMLDPQMSSELLVGTCRVWRGGPATSSAGTYTALSNNFDTGAGNTCSGEINTVRSLAAGGPKDANGFSKVLYAGTDGFGSQTNPAGGRVFVTTNAGTVLMADKTGSINTGQFPVSAIAIDPADATGQTAFVAIMGFHVGHVFKTTNAGTSWTAFSGSGATGLPDAPADALLIDSSTSTVYVGTDVGVFASSTATASWTEVGPATSPSGSGYLPNVPVTALRLFTGSGKKLLRASTYGRGIWQYDLLGATAVDYQLSLTNSTGTVFPTQTAIFNGKLTAVNGYASPVALSCAAGTTAPPATCAAVPSSVTPTGTGAAFAVNASGAVADYLFKVHAIGTDAGVTTHDAAITLHIVDFALGAPFPTSVSVQQGNTSAGMAFVVSGAGAFNGTVTLSCPASGMPAGVTCNFSPSASVSALPATVTLTFTASASAALVTNQAITISANTSGAPAAKTQSVSLTVTVPAADYQLTISNSPQSATVNTSGTFNGTLKALNGYASAVNLSCGAGAPPTCTVSPNPVTPTVAGAAFTVVTQSNLAQPYNFNVNGVGTDAAHVSHTASATFNSLFTLTLAGSTPQTVNAGVSAQYTLTVTPVGASTFPSVVSIACSGLPAGATCSNPSVAAGASGTQTLMLTINTLGPGRAAIRPVAGKRGSRMPFFLWASAVGMVVGGFVRRPGVRKNAASLMVLLLASSLILTSCGGSGGGGGGGGGGGVSVLVSPASASKFPTQQQQFTATVSGSTNTAVTWQVNGVTGGSPAAGTIDANGMYTAPSAVPNPATVMVSAVAQADVTKSGSARMTIQAPTPAGTYTITVTATVGSVVQSTTVGLVVN